jgi:hypothetical protein
VIAVRPVPLPPPALRCASHRVQASLRAPSAAGITWRLDGRLIARLRPWQGVAFRPGIAGPGRHVLTARLVFRDRPAFTIVVLRFGVCG